MEELLATVDQLPPMDMATTIMTTNMTAPSPTDPDASEPCAAPEKGVWSKEEHARFLEAIQKYPKGPWRAITEHVGTRSVRQVQTHAQKYQEKVARRERGLQKNRQKVVRTEHAVDEATYEFVNRPRAAKGRRKGSTSTASTTTTPSSLPTKPTKPTAIKSRPMPPPLVEYVVEDPYQHTHTQYTDHGQPPLVEYVVEDPQYTSPLSPIELDSIDMRGLMISCTSDEVIREAGDLLNLSPTPSLCGRPSMASSSASGPERKKKKKNKLGDLPSIDESLDFFLKLMTFWGGTVRR